MRFGDATHLVAQLDQRAGYLAGTGLAAAAFLALHGNRPLLLEGAPGVGKTAFAEAMATVLDRPIERVQCYPGLDASQVLYDWNFAAQMLALRAAGTGDHTDRLPELWDEKYLVARPILRALRNGPAVLLIDEVDRAEEDFEALLLQVLDKYEVTIPELGTVRAEVAPFVVLTSNRTREPHDAIKRRCFYHWIDHPGPELEARILHRHVAGLAPDLAIAITEIMAQLRRLDLAKQPSLAETIDYARAVHRLGAATPDDPAADAAICTLVKHHDDEAQVRRVLARRRHDR
ncbi:MoxR family ATPase [Solwaraspora sp. WMMD937]|uniref:AAA family ATPase n=1 Tax=Solwaraspora sp. WMMD937 TaxID=3016090 RepID=UPI002499F897|nr:MoxR family ATPase [Solwaraspora sp. WMMD937]WFE22772.1 MoxR family ATPase [Solwaraspora sp. WMMD937]